jgi:protein involved in polysaccharide export with SLBB domain
MRIKNAENITSSDEGRGTRDDGRIVHHPSSIIHQMSLSILFLAIFLSGGCSDKILDPSGVGRFRTAPAVTMILDSLGVAEETSAAWEQGEEPRLTDSISVKSDYTFMSGDIVRISIFELRQDNVQFISDYVVTETGKISIPEVGVVDVTGLSELTLENHLKQKLSPNILKNPQVTVTLLSSQQRTFSILGDGVGVPSRYLIPQKDFRLTDALAMANGLRNGSQDKVSNIYISRPLAAATQNLGLRSQNSRGKMDDGRWMIDESSLVSRPSSLIPQNNVAQASEFGKTGDRGQGSADMKSIPYTLNPKPSNKWPKSNVVISSSEMITDNQSANSDLYELSRNGPMTAAKGGLVTVAQPQQSQPQQNQPQTVNEPASVQEVLKTLSERTGGNNTNTSYTTPQSQNAPLRSSAAGQRNLQNSTAINSSRQQYSASTAAPGQPNIFDDGEVDWIYQNGQWMPVPKARTPSQPAQAQPTQTQPMQTQPMQAQPQQPQTGHIEWILKNGQWVPVQVGTVEQMTQSPTLPVSPIPSVPSTMAPGLELTQKGAETRLIKVPLENLFAGEPRYNIIIMPGDTIFVPIDIVGTFSIMGNVNRSGTIQLTGQPMTLKQAIAAAGGLGPLAMPKRCEVVRRISRNREEIVMVDLDKIFNGEQPDFFIKPNDIINVGTDVSARFRAVLRNAFRATYGFGFVYDRNFADRDFYNSPLPDWF